jgi:hypothetical protein
MELTEGMKMKRTMMKMTRMRNQYASPTVSKGYGADATSCRRMVEA